MKLVSAPIPTTRTGVMTMRDRRQGRERPAGGRRQGQRQDPRAAGQVAQTVSGGGRAVGLLPLVFGLFAGPIIWSLHELAGEIMVSSACSTRPGGFASERFLGVSGWELIFFVMSLVAILGAIAGAVVSYRAWKATRVGTALTGEQGGALGRSGWMAVSGMLLSTMFLFGILLATSSIFFLSGCS
ncbi:MAG: hypothetical protein ACR2PL_08785 [Dehalococcoidia bacterium]